MARLQLRTQLVIAALVIISAFTGAILVIVQYMVRSEIRQQAGQSVDASVRAFKNVETQRDAELSRTASLLAELPPLMALMTTEHAPTIQDASQPYWQLAGSDLFVLANTQGSVLGFHIKNPGWTQDLAQDNLKHSLEQDAGAAWWFANGQLYRIVIRPIAIGPEPVRKQLGVLVVGYQVDSTLAEQLATVSGAEIVLSTADTVVASTLSPEQQNNFKRWIQGQPSSAQTDTTAIELGSTRYETASVLIGGDSTPLIRCYVFVSLDRLNLFQQNLNRLIFILGISAVLLSTVLLGFVARTITRPLSRARGS